MRVSSPRHPQVRSSRVVFNVTAASAIGETICVSGDHPLLGAWEERDALELVTTPEYYPTWYSLEPVNLPLGQTITYKYFIKSGGQFSRWESEEGDRMLTPRGRDMVVNEEIKTSTEVAASAAPPWSSSSASASASASFTASNTQLPSSHSSHSSHSSQSFGSAQSSFSNSVPLPLPQLHPDPTGSSKTMEQEATTAHHTTLDPAATNTTTTTQTTLPTTSRTNPRVIISPNFVPPRSPSSPVRSSPNLSSLSPRTSNGSDTNSEFEELQLDGRDAVIIASVFLPVRVRRGEAASETTATATAATKPEHSPPTPPWHIEWDDSALLARPALFSRKLHVDQDDHKMSYVGLVPMEGDAEELTLEDQDDLRRQLEPFRCTPIFLKKSQRLAFYEGFCHKALWKMVHNWVDIYGLHTTRWWDEDEHINQYQSYLAVNAIFAQAIVEEYSEGDMIWVNGHELCLVSSYVLRKATTATIGIFIHSPFPSSEIFRTLSVREDILRGMLNCDQIGFQSYEYARHFLTCCRRVLDLKDHTERQGFSVVRYQGRDVRITVAHANIESRLVTSKLAETKCQSVIAALHSDLQLKGRIVVGGIDRLELMQGITNKLLGYEHFLSEHPSWVGRIVLVQYGIQCKHRGEDYDKTRVEVAKLVTRINRRYTGSSDGGRRPCVIYRELSATTLSFEDRLALWKATDIMLVCPRREGLNLLPFEYLSSRPTFGANAEKPGVLLLSEFCSCCFVLSGAIKFNPYHTQSVSRAINDALHLSDEEKDERWRDCYDWVQQNPVSLWAERVLLDLKNARKNPMEFAYEGMGMGPRYRMTCTRAGFTRLENETVINAYRRSNNRLILLDIGGTLLSQVKLDNIHLFTNAKTGGGGIGAAATEGKEGTIGSTKQKSEPARPSKHAMDAIARLSADTNKNTVFVISGQDNDSIAPLFEHIPNLGIVTDSGYTYRWSRSTAFQTLDAHFELAWMDTADEIMQIYCRRTTGSYIENKQFAVLWRFGDADPDYGPLQASEMVDHLNNVLSNFSVIVIKGKGYVEVRPEGVDKGSVIRKILQFMDHTSSSAASFNAQGNAQGPVDFILCVGDDVADEAMFSELLSYQGDKLLLNEELDLGNGGGGGGGSGGSGGSGGGGGGSSQGSQGTGGLGKTSKHSGRGLRANMLALKNKKNSIHNSNNRSSGVFNTAHTAHTTTSNKTTKTTKTTKTNKTNKTTNANASNSFGFGNLVTGGNSSEMSTYDLWRQQYRSFRKGAAKGARGEVSKSSLGPPLAVRLSKTSKQKNNHFSTSDTNTPLPPSTAAATHVAHELAMFTVTVGRKPSEASYFYDSPDDVVELLSSLAKTTSIGEQPRFALYKSSGNSQRSASLSDLSSLMSNLDASGRSAFFWSNEVPEWGTSGANGTASTGMPDGFNGTKTTIAQKRENDRADLRRETQQARLNGRLTESTSLSNLAKLVEEGEGLNEESVADSVSALTSVSAAYQTMEQYMDFEEEEEAPGF